MSPAVSTLRALGKTSIGRLARPSPDIAFVALTLLLTAAVVAAFAASVTRWTPMAFATLPLVFLSAAWIGGGAATALIGLLRPVSRSSMPTGWMPAGTTAVLVTMCGEAAAPAAAHLAALRRSLLRRGLGERTRIFVISDTSGDTRIAAEEAALRDLIDAGDIVYRRRAVNIGRKPGNIADWLDQHGAEFDYMLVLDSDSRMSADRIHRMIWRIETRPSIGLLQAGIALVPGQTRFGRHQRLSSRLLSPNFVRGFAAWTGQTGNYWGHNAMIRVAAFREAAHLPILPGRAPFGGSILSHDFVEAAWIRRAGWTVELDADLAGSAEDAPQTLEEFHRRDRRWCQGNLQHLRLLREPGLHPLSRLHLASGAFSYLASPVWLILVAVVASGAVPVEGALPVALIALLLLLPKFCALPSLIRRARTLRRRAVVARAAVGELLMSALMAPLVMVRQVGAVGSILLGRDCGWKSGRTPRFTLPRGMVEALAGAGICAFGLLPGTASIEWLMPIVLPLLLAPLLVRYLDSEA
jgi:membrane glycosyltransferase